MRDGQPRLQVGAKRQGKEIVLCGDEQFLGGHLTCTQGDEFIRRVKDQLSGYYYNLHVGAIRGHLWQSINLRPLIASVYTRVVRNLRSKDTQARGPSFRPYATYIPSNVPLFSFRGVSNFQWPRFLGTSCLAIPPNRRWQVSKSGPISNVVNRFLVRVIGRARVRCIQCNVLVRPMDFNEEVLRFQDDTNKFRPSRCVDIRLKRRHVNGRGIEATREVGRDVTADISIFRFHL